MDNAASLNPIPGEDLRAQTPTPEGQDREYNMWSEDIFNSGMRNLQSENLHFYYKDHRGQIQGPFRRDEMIEWLEHGTMQLLSREIMPPVVPDAPENTRISEDVTQTTGLKSSASESIEVKTSLECIPDTKISEDVTQTTGLKSSASESTEVKTSLESNPDRSHETVNSVSTEAGERKEASKEMTPMSPSESLPWGISANAALQKGRPVREIVQEEKERREASGMGKIDMSLREKRSLARDALSRPCAGGTDDKSSGS